MNVIARLGFELACYDFADNRFNHYTTGTPPFIFTLCTDRTAKSIIREVFFSDQVTLDLVLYSGLGNLFVSLNPGEFSEFPFLEQILFGSKVKFQSLPGRSHFPPSRLLSFIHFALVNHICLIWDKPFCLCHYTVYINYYAAYYCFLIQHNPSKWATVRKDSVSLMRFRSHSCPCLLVWNLARLVLELSIKLFFLPFVSKFFLLFLACTYFVNTVNGFSN